MDEAEGTKSLPVPSTVSFEAVYAAEHDRLVRLAALLLGSTAVAEDFVQDAFAKLYGRFERIETPAAWLHTVGLNACRNERRHWMVVRKHSRALAEEARAPDPPVSELIDSLRSLPVRQRAVVVLRFYEDLPEAEIAQLLGMPLGIGSQLTMRISRSGTSSSTWSMTTRTWNRSVCFRTIKVAVSAAR